MFGNIREIDGLKYLVFTLPDGTASGRELELAYDFNAITEVEQASGENLFSALMRIGGGGNGAITAGELRALFLAALEAGPKPCFPELLKVEGADRDIAYFQEALLKAGSLIRVDLLGLIMGALSNAYTITFVQDTSRLLDLEELDPTKTAVPPSSSDPQPAETPAPAAANGGASG